MEPPTPVVSFTVEPTSPFKGETITLTWSVTDADSIVISGIGAVPPSDSRQETVLEPRTYELRATNRFNKTVAKQVRVLAQDWPRPTLSIWAEPNPVIIGRSTTVSWRSEFAKSVVIDLFGTVEPSGSKSVDVDHSVLIHAKAEGPGGSHTADVMVEARQLVTVSIPKDQEVWVRLLQPLGSAAVSHSEDAFQGTLQRDLRIGAMTVATEGSAVWGRVARVEAPGRVRGRASIEAVLERLTLLDGSIAQVVTDTVRREKSSIGRDIARALIGTGAGAAAGAALDGKSGAAKGAAGGAGVGIAIDVTERGEDVFIPAGTQIKFKTTRAVSAEMLRVP